MNLNHVGISVVNLERSVQFYCNMLNMAVIYTAPFGGDPYEDVLAIPDVSGTMCVLKNNTVQLEIFHFERPEPATKSLDEPVSSHGISHFGVDVDDIDATYQRLAAGGVKMHSAVRQFPSGMRAVYVRDPDGNVIELLQRR